MFIEMAEEKKQDIIREAAAQTKNDTVIKMNRQKKKEQLQRPTTRPANS